MLEPAEVDRIVNRATQRVVGDVKLASVHSEPAIDSEGKDALHITLIFANDNNPAVEGDVGLDTIIGIRKALVDAGEFRFPIIDFTTESEEASGVDSQS